MMIIVSFHRKILMKQSLKEKQLVVKIVWISWYQKLSCLDLFLVPS